MVRAFAIVIGLSGAFAGCSPQVTIVESFDAGTDAPPCDGLSVCETDDECAGEQACSNSSCMSDKGTAAHWCICKSPNPGPVGCKNSSDCPPSNVCWSWTCSQSHCQAIAADGGSL
jgi:hypothetical protein